MSLAPSNRYMNWIDVSVVYPVSGSPVTITLASVLDVEPDISTQQEMFYGDNNHFPAAIRNTTKTRSLTVVGGDCYKLLAIPEDAVCTVSATLLDAANQVIGTGSGSIVLTLVNALREKAGIKAPNNKYGTLAVSFNAFAVSDADPMGIVQL